MLQQGHMSKQNCFCCGYSYMYVLYLFIS